MHRLPKHYCNKTEPCNDIKENKADQSGEEVANLRKQLSSLRAEKQSDATKLDDLQLQVGLLSQSLLSWPWVITFPYS